MKKLNLAMAISLLAAASSTHAVTIYEGKGLKYTVKGDVQIQLIQDSGDDEDLDVEYDDAELKNNITYDVGNGTKAFAQVDYDFKKESTEETYVGLDFGAVKFWVGETDYVTDDFGVEENIDVVDVDGDAFPEDASEDLIGVEFSAGPATIALSHDLSVGTVEDEDDDTIIYDEASSTDLMVSVPAGPIELGFAYQAYSEEDSDTDTFGLSATGEFGPIGFGIAYSQADEDGEDKLDVTSLVVSTKVAPTTGINIGYDITEQGDTEVNAWYANVVYKFPAAKKVSIFAELADTDEDDTDIGYLFGMRVKF